ncbi:Protein MAK32 [Erysiphe neolycopersici]|uniref:Protein MAK32 n=1 Tax=Erysiphe neolycopersici TaxID=212602 RepID=A0A420HQ24_9PEZI|nr:Protein MAK32 [Erysiphe neolycopersici]
MEKDAENSDQEYDFCTLGMFILDEIHYPPPKLPVSDVLGGAGTYAAIGARLFSPAPLSKRISWIVDAGSDFPTSIIPLIKSWETSVLLRINSSRLTTRGLNSYDGSQKRNFKYLTPKLALDVPDLESHPAYLMSKSFHLICSPLRCISIVKKLLHARKQLSPLAPKPIIVWEPVPYSCLPSELLNLTNCLPYVDICSPNHIELLNFFSEPLSSDENTDAAHSPLDAASIESACEQLLAAMPLQTYALVIRCGSHGVYISKNGGRSCRPSRRPSPSGRTRQKRPANHARGGLTPDIDMEALFADFDPEHDREPLPINPGTSLWLPAYFDTLNESKHQSQIIDPTGAGNSFLGALALALARGIALEEAVCWGTVAASFMLEQVGVPVCSKDTRKKDKNIKDVNFTTITDDECEYEESWNEDSVSKRLDEFLQRVRCKK